MVCGAPDQPSTFCSITAADITTGCKKVRVPRWPCGSGAFERSSTAGELMAPPASTKCRATMVVCAVPRVAPLGCTATQRRAWALPPLITNCSARVSTNSVAPLSRAAGMVVTSIDCLALVGQPKPHDPRLQQPLTLRAMAAEEMPSLSAPRRSRSLFSLGGTSQGVTLSRRSASSKYGSRAARSKSLRPKCCCQWLSVGSGVRKELVQFTVVEPPTQRPCRMETPLSVVLRLPLSW